MAIPKLNADVCTGCGVCQSECPSGAITMDNDNHPVIDAKTCTECGACIAACPTQALSE